MRLKSLSTNSVEHGLKLYKHGPLLTICGVRGRDHKVPSSRGCLLWDFQWLVNTFGASTDVVPRKPNRERLALVVRTCFSIDVK